MQQSVTVTNNQRAFILLPQSDSPTIPRVSPWRREKLTPSNVLVMPSD